MSGPNPFLNGSNYQTIVGFIKQKYQTQLRTPSLPERLDTRIQRTVQHYMTEVARAKGGKQPVTDLNKEVVKETTASVDTWMKKQDQTPVATTLGAFVKPDEYGRLFQDTQQRYESMMADRTPPAMPVPPMPEFLTGGATTDSLEDPVTLMQRAQKQREDQARALGQLGHRPHESAGAMEPRHPTGGRKPGAPPSAICVRRPYGPPGPGTRQVRPAGTLPSLDGAGIAAPYSPSEP